MASWPSVKYVFTLKYDDFQKTRKVLAEKIAQLNSAIDDVSSQLRTEDSSDEIAVAPDEIEAAV